MHFGDVGVGKRIRWNIDVDSFCVDAIGVGPFRYTGVRNEEKSMKPNAIVVPCVVFPFALAIGFSFLAATGGPSAASFGLVGIPCGLLGMSSALIIGLTRSYEDRIAQIEQKLESIAAQTDES